MANIRFKLKLDVYNDMMNALVHNGGMSIADDIINEAYITNNEDAPDDKLLVSIKVDAEHMGTIMKIAIDAKKYDATTYKESLLKIFRARLEKEAEEAKKQAEYDAWLESCFDKYVVDNLNPTCKDLAVLINDNCLKPGQDKIKYQNIMRPLKAYRLKKFCR